MSDEKTEKSSDDSKDKLRALREERATILERNRELLKKQNSDTALIKKALKDGSMTIPELANETGLKSDLILYYVSAMKKYGEITNDGHSGGYCRYSLVEKKRHSKK
jgi:predicted transcriptional regulator